MKTDYTGLDHYVENGTDNLQISKRFNPFEDDMPNLSKLILSESCIADTQNNDRLRDKVDEAIKCLPDFEQDFIRQRFFLGLGLKELGLALGKTKLQIINQQAKVIDHLKTAIRKVLNGEVDKDIHPDCPICQADKADDLNVFIHLWYDYYGGTLQGITAVIREKFGGGLADILAANPRLMESHIEDHLHLGKSGNRNKMAGRKPLDNPKKRHVSFKTSMEIALLDEIRDAAQTMGKTQSLVIREAVVLGLPLLLSLNETMLRMKKITSQLGSVDILEAYLGEKGIVDEQP